MKHSTSFILTVISFSCVSFSAFAIDQRISDFRDRAQAATAQTPSSDEAMMQESEQLQKLAPAAGGMSESFNNSETAKQGDRVLEKKFYHMKR